MKYRALTDLSWWKDPKKEPEGPDDWADYKAGEIFEPLPHFNMKKALERGIAEVATEKKGKVSDGEA